MFSAGIADNDELTDNLIECNDGILERVTLKIEELISGKKPQDNMLSL